MKQKFSDFGRCLVCYKNPCQCAPKENKEPLPSSPNKTIEEFREKFPYLHDEYAFDEDGTNIETWLTRALNESHAAGMEEFRKKAIEAVTTVFKEISDLNIDGDEKYWKVEAFGYAPYDMEASKDKFFPKQVKEKLLAALNKLTP